MENFTKSNNGVVIHYETFGDPQNKCIVLINGAGVPALFWTDEFCQQLADKDRFVVRYDNRDSGLSSRIDFKEMPYNLINMSEDALKVMDTLKIKKAHIVGKSFGGYLAQLLAVYHPDRIFTITSMMSTPNSTVVMDAMTKGYVDKRQSFPPPEPEVMDLFASWRAKTKQKKDKKTMVANSVKMWKVLSGANDNTFDETYWNKLAAKIYDQTNGRSGMRNHFKAVYAGPIDRTELIKYIKLPAFILHGAKDPILPVKHAIRTAELIPNSKLAIIKKMGHMLNPAFFQEVISLIVDHTS